MNFNKDQYGFYTVGNFKTYSKLEAIDCMRRTNIHLEWNFQNEYWKMVDWLKEPMLSLTELYANRARQIRQNYDHVVLMYSGGIDSQNVLDTFVANGIKFDEVATMNYNTADPRPWSYFHCEQTIVSYPHLKNLQDRGINFLHRSIDLTDISYRLFTDKEISENYVYYNNAGWGWNRLAKGLIRRYCKDWQNLTDKGKKIVLVWGTDKPRIYLQNQKLCFKFIDLVIDTAVTGLTQISNNQWEHDELFYWSSNFPEIVVKQSHIIKNFIRSHPELIALMQYDANNQTYHINVNDLTPIDKIGQAWGESQAMSWRDCICKLIYPYFNQKTFNNGKVDSIYKSIIYSARDEIWLKDIKFNKELMDQLRYLDNIDPYWKNNQSNINDGIKGCTSHPYWVESECHIT